jgi:Protein of unknown function (DUF3352)
MRALRFALLVAFAFALAGCGAKNEVSSSIPSGADFAPASSVVYVTGITDPSSSQWQKADELLGRFPGREKLLASARKDLAKDGLTWERDVKPALGDDLNLVLLSFKDADHNYVFFTKPRDEVKFNKLLESGTGDDVQVHRKIDGWTVFADNEKALDNFAAAHATGNSLSDDDAFKDAMKGLPDDSALRGFVAGEPIYDLIQKEAATNPDTQSFKSFSDSFGRLKYVAFSSAAEDEGVAVQASYESTKKANVGSYSAELDDTLPSGALLYVSFGDLEDYLNQLLETVNEESPEFRKQLEQMQKGLGFDLRRDALPLFSKEGAIAVYHGDGEFAAPNVLFALNVPDDEDRANKLIDRLAALAGIGGVPALPFNVDGAEGKEFEIPDEGFSIYTVVTDGKAFVSNSKATIEQALGDAEKLSDDSVYQDARDAASAPDETAGFVYANLKVGLPYVFDFADQSEPGSISPDARANTKPLQSAILYTKQDGDRTKISGFLTIK